MAALIVGAGIAGFEADHAAAGLDHRSITGVLTVVYIILAMPTDRSHGRRILAAGSPQAVIGALVFVMTGFGLGWVNAAADYSRYLPPLDPQRAASSAGRRSAARIAPVVLVVFGLLLAGSSPKLSKAIGADPIGALTTILPVWFLIPFAIVAILGLVGGAVLDIYSSGLALLSAGIPIPRYVAAGVDGVVMIVGAIYVAFFAPDFVSPFEAFLVTLGVPIAAWCGVFLADFVLRRRDYSDADLHDRRGRYGDVRAVPILLVVVGHRARLGPRHEHVRRAGVAQLAGLPARPVRARRPDRAVGLRQPRRARRPPHRIRRHAAAHPLRRCDGRRRRRTCSGHGGRAGARMTRTALVVSTCSTCSPIPRAPGPRPATRARPPGVRRLLPSFAGVTVCTRFVAPAQPAGAWVPYYAAVAVRAAPGGRPDLVDRPRPRPGRAIPSSRRRRSASGARSSPPPSGTPTSSWSRASPPTAACSRQRSPPRTPDGAVVVPADACAGLSEADHQRALDAMALVRPADPHLGRRRGDGGPMTTRRDRALGALVGLAVGDALGMPTQGLSREHVRSVFGRITGLLPAPDDNPISAGLPAGSITDDTEQALLVADLLIEDRGRIDPGKLAVRLADWEDRMRERGSLDLLGPSTRKAVKRSWRGRRPSSPARTGTTNGAAMRIAPVGIAVPPGDLDRPLDPSRRHASSATATSSPSPAPPLSPPPSAPRSTGSRCTSRWRSPSAPPDGCAPRVVGRRRRCRQRASPGCWSAPPAAIRAQVVPELVALIGTSLATQESVPCAFGVLALHPDDPWAACCEAAAARRRHRHDRRDGRRDGGRDRRRRGLPRRGRSRRCGAATRSTSTATPTPCWPCDDRPGRHARQRRGRRRRARADAPPGRRRGGRGRRTGAGRRRAPGRARGAGGGRGSRVRRADRIGSARRLGARRRSPAPASPCCSAPCRTRTAARCSPSCIRTGSGAS